MKLLILSFLIFLCHSGIAQKQLESVVRINYMSGCQFQYDSTLYEFTDLNSGSYTEFIPRFSPSGPSQVWIQPISPTEYSRAIRYYKLESDPMQIANERIQVIVSEDEKHQFLLHGADTINAIKRLFHQNGKISSERYCTWSGDEFVEYGRMDYEYDDMVRLTARSWFKYFISDIIPYTTDSVNYAINQNNHSNYENCNDTLILNSSRKVFIKNNLIDSSTLKYHISPCTSNELNYKFRFEYAKGNVVKHWGRRQDADSTIYPEYGYEYIYQKGKIHQVYKILNNTRELASQFEYDVDGFLIKLIHFETAFGQIQKKQEFRYHFKDLDSTLSTDLEFIVYPNPANKQLNFQIENEIKNIVVFNHLGELVLEIKGNYNSIDISNLAKGQYTIQLKTMYETYKMAFVKQ